MARGKKEISPLNDIQSRLVEENMSLVEWFLKLTPRGVYLHDKEGFRQELMVSLVIAASTYDSSKGSFSGHAVWQMKGARSGWMHKKRYHKNVLNFDVSIQVEDDQSPEQFIIDTRPDNREINLFREALDSLSLQDRANLPDAWKMFIDLSKSLKYNGPHRDIIRIKLESESLLKLISAFRERVG